MSNVIRIHPDGQNTKGMAALVLKGKVNVEGMEFHHIEGGFGGDKRTLLVKEIANIHGREVREINEVINLNRKRFKDGVDILDIKGSEFAIGLTDSEIYTRQAMNASKNIYLLSDRGYAKLLKILEDDTAWEVYDMLVDKYFNMKRIIREQRDPVMGIIAKDPVMAIRFDQLQMKDQLNSIEERIRALEVQPEKQPELSPLEFVNKICAGEFDKLSGTYKLSVPQIQPVPITDECEWYTCKDIANLVNLPWPKYQTIGRLASRHNLKTEQYSKTIDIGATKTPGRVLFQQTVYNEVGKDKLIDIIRGAVAGRKAKRKSRRRKR